MRTVNNRHFKLSARISESYAMMEPALEQLVREKVRRGTVQVNLRIDRPRRPEDYRLNLVALAQLSRSASKGLRRVRRGDARRSRALLSLPGVVEDCGSGAASRPIDDWPEIREWSAEALARLEAARAAEGEAMAERADRAGPRRSTIN